MQCVCYKIIVFFVVVVVVVLAHSKLCHQPTGYHHYHYYWPFHCGGHGVKQMRTHTTHAALNILYETVLSCLHNIIIYMDVLCMHIIMCPHGTNTFRRPVVCCPVSNE